MSARPVPQALLFVVLALLAAAFPAFAAPTFNVRDHGATGNGKTHDTAAIQKSIDTAAAAGGGAVVFPPGTYLSGSIDLKSRVRLHLEKGATLLGSTRLTDYRRLNFLALIRAHNQHDIGISGQGVIDGQGKAVAGQVIGPVRPGSFPYAYEDKRPVLINFLNCRNVTVRDITLRESACWVQLYRDCQRVLIENITVRTLAAFTNDGLDIDGCTDVIVRGCDIDSQDDGICLKSSRQPCRNVRIENCRVRSSCNALKFGTASAKGFQNITCHNIEIYDTYISAIALECVDGGVMENVDISKVRITGTSNPLFIRLGHRNTKGAPGTVRNIRIRDVTAHIPDRPRSGMNKFPPYWRHRCRTMVTGSITGLPGHPVRDITLKDITLTYGGIGTKRQPDHLGLDQLDKVPQRADAYPESTMFGTLPAWGLYCRHATGLRFENVSLRVEKDDYRPALICDDVEKLFLDRFRIEPKTRGPAIVLKDVRKAIIRHSPAPAHADPFIMPLGTTTGVITQ